MANYNISKITCEDPEILISLGNRRTGVPHSVSISEDYKTATIESRGTTFHEGLLNLSREFPDASIYCEYNLEQNWGTERDVVKYESGEFEIIETLYYPMINGIADLTNDETAGLMYKKIETIANTLDEGDTVTLTFIANNKYKIDVTFDRQQGEAKVYCKSDEWVEKTTSPQREQSIDDLPF